MTHNIGFTKLVSSSDGKQSRLWPYVVHQLMILCICSEYFVYILYNIMYIAYPTPEKMGLIKAKNKLC